MHPLRPAFDRKASAGPKRGPVEPDHGSALMPPGAPSEWGRRHCGVRTARAGKLTTKLCKREGRRGKAVG